MRTTTRIFWTHNAKKEAKNKELKLAVSECFYAFHKRNVIVQQKSNYKEGFGVVTFHLLNLHNDKRQIALACIRDQQR